MQRKTFADMTKRIAPAVGILAALLLSSCQTTGSALTGGALGGAAGALLDGKNRKRGAAIGAATGALAGAAISGNRPGYPATAQSGGGDYVEGTVDDTPPPSDSNYDYDTPPPPPEW